jgi:arylsulfatase A-like enzyme
VVLADVAPTLLRLAGARVPASMTGRALPLGAGDDPATAEPRDLFAYYLFPSMFTYQALSVRRGSWKLVVHNPEAPDRFRSELYDTAHDPAEEHPITTRPDLEESLRQALRRTKRSPGDGGSPTPDAEALRALGYIE